MEKKLINEINRVSELMDVKPLLSEQAALKFFQGLFNFSDDIIKSISKTGGNKVDDALKVLKNADNIADQKVIDGAIEVIIKNVDFDSLAKLLIKNRFGSTWDKSIQKFVNAIEKNPSKKTEILSKLDEFIDKLPDNFSFLQDAPDEIVKALQKQARLQIDNILSTSLRKGLKLLTGSLVDIFKSYIRTSDYYSKRVMFEADEYVKIMKQYQNLLETKKLTDANKLRKNADKLLNSIDISLGIIKRQDKEFFKTTLDALNEQIRITSKGSNERKKLTDLYNKIKESESVVSIFQYFRKHDFDVVEFWRDVNKLRRQRKYAMKRIFYNPKNVKEGIEKLSWWRAVIRVFTGDLAQTLNALFKGVKSIKDLVRILSIDIISRLMGLPIALAALKTAKDFAGHLLYQDRLDNYENIQEYLKWNFDYKSYDRADGFFGSLVGVSRDFFLNIVSNVFKFLGFTAPLVPILQTISKMTAGSLYDLVNKTKNVLEKIDNKNLSNEEKLEEIKKLYEESSNYLDKVINFFMGQSHETVHQQILKKLAEIESTTDTTYDEIKVLLPPSYRDNFYRDESGAMFIEKAGVKYPVYIKDNNVAIEINGKPYKLDDVEF